MWENEGTIRCFAQRAIDLLESGKSVKEVAEELVNGEVAIPHSFS